MIPQIFQPISGSLPRSGKLEGASPLGPDFLELMNKECMSEISAGGSESSEAPPLEAPFPIVAPPNSNLCLASPDVERVEFPQAQLGQSVAIEAEVAGGVPPQSTDLTNSDSWQPLAQPVSEPPKLLKTDVSRDSAQNSLLVAFKNDGGATIQPSTETPPTKAAFSAVLSPVDVGQTAEPKEKISPQIESDRQRQTGSNTGLAAVEITVHPSAIPVRPSTRADAVWLTRAKLEVVDAQEGNTSDDLPAPEIKDGQPDLSPLDIGEKAGESLLSMSANLSDGACEPGPANATWHPGNNQKIEPRTVVNVQAVPAAPSDLSSQLIQHLPAARSEAVEVLLNPAELGKVRFEIQHSHDTIRIVLTAERAETMEMLRRHSDQLLQEFRQSGFTGTSLSFGQWGHQQKQDRTTQSYASFESGSVDPSAQNFPVIPPPVYVEGQGLNLRL